MFRNNSKKLTSVLLSIFCLSACAQGPWADYTSKIENASFENGLNGWKNNGMQQQSNTEPKAMKVGNSYCEKWVQAPANLSNASLTQTLTNLPTGDYILSANCHAELQGNTTAEITGVTLFIGDKSIDIDDPKRYEVYTHIDGGDLTIGFDVNNTTANWVTVDDFNLIWAENAEEFLANRPYTDNTSSIANASFESGFSGWTNTGMQTQKNNEAAAMKDGTYYCEKWVESPNGVADCSVKQTIADLPAGDYILSANCHAELQKHADTAITGVTLYAGNKSVEVTSADTYYILIHSDGGSLEIGFKAESTNANWVTVDNFHLTWAKDGAAYMLGIKKSKLDEQTTMLQKLLDTKDILPEDMRSNANNAVAQANAAATQDEIEAASAAVLTAYSECKTFRLEVTRDEPYTKYLFAYFPNNNDENLYYAVSDNGFDYIPLNDGKRVMASDTVAIKKGIRDPHVLRGADGKTFYMVATDMKCAEGWSSNRGMVLYKSTDLIHWQHSTVHFPTRFPEWKNVTRVWAPATIWDPEYENADGSKGRYLIYYSLLTNDGKCTYDKVYYSYANDDFTDLLTEPEYFYDRGGATIDADIVYDESDRLYHMIFKNEGAGGICAVTAKRLTPEAGQQPGSQWSTPSGTIQQTNVAVEGGGIFRLINTNDWVVMYDCYNSGYYQFCKTTDWEKYTLTAQTTMKGAFTPRHGSVLPITAEEYNAVLEAFPTKELVKDETAITSKPVADNGPTDYYTLKGEKLGTELPATKGIYIAKNRTSGTASLVNVK